MAHEICGKLVVAVDETEVARLKNLEERGRANGLEGLRWLKQEEIREIEPHAAGIAALRVPQEGIVDYPAVCAALVARLRERGARVVTSARVNRLRRSGSGWVAETPAGEFPGDFFINCAGLHSDRVAELAGEQREVRILPFRGEYYKIRPERQFLVRNLIYPVPDPRFPFLGVHFTRLIHGGIEAGPNAVLATAREGYKKTDFRPGDLWDALSYGGFWKFMRRYPSMCWYELRRVVQPGVILPFAPASGAGHPDRGPGDGRFGRAGAGYRAGGRAGAGFQPDCAAEPRCMW